jgi:hypothetical protein
MLLMWEQKFDGDQDMKAEVRIDMNDIEDFVRFKVTTNSVPIKQTNENGKDIVVDWYMLDGYDTDNKLWVDANGL